MEGEKAEAVVVTVEIIKARTTIAKIEMVMEIEEAMVIVVREMEAVVMWPMEMEKRPCWKCWWCKRGQ